MFRKVLLLSCVVLLAASACERGTPVASGEQSTAPPSSGVAKSSDKSIPSSGNPKTSVAPAEIAVDEPDAKRPVTAAAALQPVQATTGESLTVVVKVKTAPTWHIYADGTAGAGIPTTLKLELPDGVEADGEWIYPPSHQGQDGQSRVYEGSVQFTRRLKIGSQIKPGPIHVTCELGYQACDPFSCRPPETRALKAAAQIVPTY